MGATYEFPDNMGDREISQLLDQVATDMAEELIVSSTAARASSSSFGIAIGPLLAQEGGYVDDPDDPGKETKFGITKRSYPELDIKNLDQDDAVDIYRKDFWNANKYGSMPPSIAAKMLEMSANLGGSQANKLLQRALGVKDDGIVGEKTLAATNKADEQQILDALVGSQTSFYKDLVKKNPVRKKWINNWLKRASSIPVPAGTEISQNFDPATIPSPLRVEEVNKELAGIPAPLSDEEIGRELSFLKTLPDEDRDKRQEDLRKRLGIGEFALNASGRMTPVEGGLFEDPAGNLVFVDAMGNRREI
jgi:lysozyme family protein